MRVTYTVGFDVTQEMLEIVKEEYGLTTDKSAANYLALLCKTTAIQEAMNCPGFANVEIHCEVDGLEVS